jgi:hypothetical protein
MVDTSVLHFEGYNAMYVHAHSLLYMTVYHSIGLHMIIVCAAQQQALYTAT